MKKPTYQQLLDCLTLIRGNLDVAEEKAFDAPFSADSHVDEARRAARLYTKKIKNGYSKSQSKIRFLLWKRQLRKQKLESEIE